jgi:hypothetical protein
MGQVTDFPEMSMHRRPVHVADVAADAADADPRMLQKVTIHYQHVVLTSVCRLESG